MVEENIKYELSSKKLTPQNDYVLAYSLSPEDKVLLEKTLDESERIVLDEVLESFKIGSYHLCIMGVRAILDHRITLICKDRGIKISGVKKGGKKWFRGLTDKCSCVMDAIIDEKNKLFLKALILEGHESNHDIDVKKDENDARLAITSFMRILKEDIFLKK